MTIIGSSPVLAVHDIDGIAEWFVRVLGCERRDPDPGNWVFCTAGAVTFMLGRCPDGPEASTIGDHSYLAYVLVDDVDAVHVRAVAEGADVVKPPTDEPWGRREMGLRTPEGHRFTLANNADDELVAARDASQAQLEDLRASRQRLVTAADADRRLLERDLHDGLQQDLVALAFNLQLARRLVDTDPTAAKSLLGEVRRDAQTALDVARAFALRIYPPLLDAAGLRAALLAAAPGTTIEVALHPTCPEDVVASVYFCCLELIRDASAIDVRQQEETVVFDVLGPAADGGSRVRDRVEVFGGQLAVSAGRIVGVLPVPERPQPSAK